MARGALVPFPHACTTVGLQASGTDRFLLHANRFATGRTMEQVLRANAQVAYCTGREAGRAHLLFTQKTALEGSGLVSPSATGTVGGTTETDSLARIFAGEEMLGTDGLPAALTFRTAIGANPPMAE